MPCVVAVAAAQTAAPLALSSAVAHAAAAGWSPVLLHPQLAAPFLPVTAFIGQRAGRAISRSVPSAPPASAPAGAKAPGAGPRPHRGATSAARRPRATGRRSLACQAVAVSAARLLLLGAKAAAAAAGASCAPLGAAGATAAALGGGLALRGAGRLLRRWRSGRRGAGAAVASKAGSVGMAGPSREITVVTYNVRGVMDRWSERAELLRSCLEGLDADVLCFQEVLTGEFAQDQRLLGSCYHVYDCRAALDSVASSGAAGAAYAYVTRALLSLSLCRSWMVAAPQAVEGWRERNEYSGSLTRSLRDVAISPFFGNSIATRLPPCPGGPPPHETLLLGSYRAAQRACLQLWPAAGVAAPGAAAGPCAAGEEGEGGTPLLLWVVNTHLDHSSPEIREEQARAIIKWMEPAMERPGTAAAVICGDLNAPPGEATHWVLQQAGYRSASKLANGREPEVTWPSGLVAPLMDQGEPHCADYVYVWAAPGHDARVLAAGVAGDAPSTRDATLYPSDHLGLRVRLTVGRTAGNP